MKLYTSIFSLKNYIRNYLKLNLKQPSTSIVTKIRLSSHKLKIERGRYTRPKTPPDKRTCKFCNEVETKSHFILFCKAYNILRDELFKEFNIDKSKLCKDTKLDKLKLLLNLSNRAQAIKLSKYLSRVQEMRQS